MNTVTRADVEKIRLAYEGMHPRLKIDVDKLLAFIDQEATPAEGWVLMPTEPTQEMLGIIAQDKWPEDWEAGKKLQAERGSELVPPVCQLEIAVGQYQRLLAARPSPSPAPDYKGFIKRLSQALLKVRPLGGSELFTRFADEFFADPDYCGEAIERMHTDLHNARIEIARLKKAHSTPQEPVTREAETATDEVLRNELAEFIAEEGDVSGANAVLHGRLSGIERRLFAFGRVSALRAGVVDEAMVERIKARIADAKAHCDPGVSLEYEEADALLQAALQSGVTR